MLATAALLLLAGGARAQLAPDSARLVAKVNVLRLLSASYEAELEYRWGERVGLALAPRLLAGPVPGSVSKLGNASGDQVRGYGLSFSPRYYFANTGTEGARLAGIYLGVRTEFQSLRLSYYQESWGEEVGPDGLSYYTYRPRDLTETISRYGGAAVLGYQCQIIKPRLRLDVSGSLNSLRSTSSAGDATRYRSSPSDYAHSGTFWSFGMNLGYVLK